MVTYKLTIPIQDAIIKDIYEVCEKYNGDLDIDNKCIIVGRVIINE